MKRIGILKEEIVHLLTTPGEQLGRWARLLRFQIQLWRFCARRLGENNATAMSAALSFRTLFALVPVLVLILLMINSFQVFGPREQYLNKLMEWTGLSEIRISSEPQAAPGETAPGQAAGATQPIPAESIYLGDWIQELVENVERKLTLRTIGPIGAVLLIWTALTLLTTMERSLNRIFGARRSRPLGRRLMLYWAVVTGGPIVLAAALYVGDKAAEMVRENVFAAWLLGVAGWLGPVLVGIVLLGLLYKLMPNTRVGFRAALGAAAVAVPLWLVAKWGLAIYVRHIPTTGLYGALGLLPLFLLWMNVSWLIFLFGAELAHTAANLERMQAAERAERLDLSPTDMLAAAVAVAQSFDAGKGPASLKAVAKQLDLPAESVSRLLDRLAAVRVVCAIDGDEAESFTLARPAETIAVTEIMQIGPDASGQYGAGQYRGTIAEAVTRAAEHAGQAMRGWTLADVIRQDSQQ